MPFLQLTLDVGSADPSIYEDILFDAGALSVTLEDAEDHPILEPAPGATPLWPQVRIKALFASSTNPLVVLTNFNQQGVRKLPDYRFETVADRAWEREWLKDFKPMPFGAHLWVCPGGQRPDDAQAIIVELDPGLAFGTGTHPTTALCLEWLATRPLSGRTLIDYGCGSGILAIAGLKLGAATAVGYDIDEQAAIATRENARRNQVSERLRVLSPQEPPSEPAEILVANILAEPLHSLAPTLTQCVQPGGHIVLSGLLRSQQAYVEAAYAEAFDFDPVASREDWVRLVGKRKSC
jgi:ribosomal protein L11 methyltransferase